MRGWTPLAFCSTSDSVVARAIAITATPVALKVLQSTTKPRQQTASFVENDDEVAQRMSARKMS